MSDYSNDAWNRLASAILLQAVRDWKVNVKKLKRDSSRDIAMYELKKIIEFIESDWFVYLTNANAPQDESVKQLISKVENKLDQKELIDYLHSIKKKNENNR